MLTPRDEYGDKIRAAEVTNYPTDADRRSPLRTRHRAHRSGDTGLFTDAFAEVIAQEVDPR